MYGVFEANLRELASIYLCISELNLRRPSDWFTLGNRSALTACLLVFTGRYLDIFSQDAVPQKKNYHEANSTSRR